MVFGSAVLVATASLATKTPNVVTGSGGSLSASGASVSASVVLSAVASIGTTQTTFARPEVYTAKFITSLTAPITSGLRPIDIQVAATQQAYGQGTFSIAIYDAGTDANPVNFEALEVTGGGASTTWTVITETGWSPLTHSSGSTVVATVFTPRSIQQPLNNHTSPLAIADPHTVYVKKSAFTAIGQLLVGIGNGIFTNLPVGTNGQSLVADSTRVGGLKWLTVSALNVLTHMGDLIVGGLNGTATRLPVGVPGSTLKVIYGNAVILPPSLPPICSAAGSGGSLFNGSAYDFSYAWSNGTVPDGGVTTPSPAATFTATSTGIVAVQCPPAPSSGLTLNVYANFSGFARLLVGSLANASTVASNTVLVSSLNNNGAPESAINTTGGYVLSWSTTSATVSSVAIQMPSDKSVTNSPITSSGTIVVSDNNQSSNTFKAGPVGGGSAVPVYRAITQADIPIITRTDEITATDFNASGLTGSTAGARFVGGTLTGAPTSGTHLKGDLNVDQTGTVWVCTAAGTPGTWAGPGISGNKSVNSVQLQATATMSAVSLGSIAPYTVIQDQKAAGTDGGTFTAGADQTRVLNTIVTDTASLATIGSNQITLPKGIYRVKATLPARAVDGHRGWLFDTTHSVTLVNGQNAFASSTNNVQNDALIDGMFILTSTSVLEVRHRCATTGTTTGFGTSLNGSFTVPAEVYTTVEIWKLGG